VTPVATTSGCSTILDPLCHVASGIGTGIFGAGAGAILSAVAGWVVSGATWLLGQIGGVLDASTSIDVGAGWFRSHFAVMAGSAAVVVLPMILLSVAQAVYRQDSGTLVRSVLVHLPLAALLAGVAIELVQLALAATDAMSSAVASGSGADVSQALSGLAKLLVAAGSVGPQSPPTFVVVLGALLVAVGAFSIWLELLVRAAAVYAAVLFLPLALASLVWPAVSHWCRRLVDTLAALILSKFVIVAILSLAVGALAAGTQSGFAPVLGGGALLLLAAFTPFTLLRLIPAVEAGAVHQLEGARQRVQHAVVAPPRSAASHAVRLAGQGTWDAGVAGTGMATDFGTAGDPDVGGWSGGSGGDAGGDGGDGGRSGPRPERRRAGGAVGEMAGGTSGAGAASIPLWRGVPGDPAAAAGLPPHVDDPAERDVTGRGPLPLWGGRPARTDSSADDSEPAFRGPATIGSDALGPVIRWEPSGDGRTRGSTRQTGGEQGTGGPGSGPGPRNGG
jgi:hypothetical protein